MCAPYVLITSDEKVNVDKCIQYVEHRIRDHERHSHPLFSSTTVNTGKDQMSMITGEQYMKNEYKKPINSTCVHAACGQLGSTT